MSVVECAADEAAAAGAKGLVHIRVQEGGTIDAPKQLKESLTEFQSQNMLAACNAQPVSPNVLLHVFVVSA